MLTEEEPKGKVVQPLVSGFVVLRRVFTRKARMGRPICNEMATIPKALGDPARQRGAAFVLTGTRLHGRNEAGEGCSIPRKVASQLNEKGAILRVEFSSKN